MKDKALYTLLVITVLGVLLAQEMGRSNDGKMYREQINKQQEMIRSLNEDVQQRDKQINLLIKENYELEKSIALQETSK